jgi:UPF0042 nucleotide-binding protein
MHFIIVTGLSGAGRSQALKRLEDNGYFCVDNLPPVLIPNFARYCLKLDKPIDHVAVAVDMRMGVMFESIYEAIKDLKAIQGLHLEVLYLDASDETLVKRFKQTRRQHPLAIGGNVMTGIQLERDKLKSLKDMAQNVIDTTTYSIKKLGEVIDRLYSQDDPKKIQICVTSFGYKRGIPLDADMVFDMRFIPNPFYVDELRELSGKDQKVKDYVLSFACTQQFIEKVVDIVNIIAPHYLEQDKKQLNIAIGCTGGMHRSVAVAEELYSLFDKQKHRVVLEHRDVRMDSLEENER